jgi:hypothetical protein
MSLSKVPFEMWREFPLILEHSGTGDFSREGGWKAICTCQVRLAAWLSDFEPVCSLQCGGGNALLIFTGSGGFIRG